MGGMKDDNSVRVRVAVTECPACAGECGVRRPVYYYIKDRRQRGARFAFILAGGHCTILPGHSFYLNRMSK